MNDVSVVVVNWNGGPKLIACLESLFLQVTSQSGGEDLTFEIILVDNGSTDGSVEEAGNLYGPRLRIIRNDANLGFAKGCNQGIEAATGAWIALINNDAVADPRWLLELWRKAIERPNTGMVASRVLRHDQRDLIDSIGVGIYPDAMSRALHRGEKDSSRFGEDHPVLIPSGAACLLSRAMLDDAGLFAEDFFAYSDDTDIALRAQLAGWKCVFAPRAVAYHHYSFTAGAYSRLKIFHAERNRIWVLVRFFPGTMILKSGFFTILRYMALIWYSVNKRLQPWQTPGQVSAGFLEAAGALTGAYISAFRGMLPQIRERKRFVSGRPGYSKTWRKWLKDYRIDLKTVSSVD